MQYESARPFTPPSPRERRPLFTFAITGSSASCFLSLKRGDHHRLYRHTRRTITWPGRERAEGRHSSTELFRLSAIDFEWILPIDSSVRLENLIELYAENSTRRAFGL